MVGRSILFSWLHNIAMKNKCMASSFGTIVSLGSAMAIASSLRLFVARLLHCTISTPSPKSPTGLLPVRSSSRTTPKLYTSLFSSTFNVYAY
ncbi:hypothetical protein OIU78_010767, partial [Salix suchowensis]